MNYDDSRKWKFKPCFKHIICKQPFWTCYNMWSHDNFFKYSHLWCIYDTKFLNHNINNENNEVNINEKKKLEYIYQIKIHPEGLPQDIALTFIFFFLMSNSIHHLFYLLFNMWDYKKCQKKTKNDANEMWCQMW